MSSIFGDGGGEGGFVDNGQPTIYDSIQNVQITAVQNSVAASTVNLNPINARLDVIEAGQIVQNTDIINLETLTNGQGAIITQNSSDIVDLQAALASNNNRDDGQDLRLNDIEATLLNLQPSGSYVTTTTYNANKLTTDNRLTSLESDMSQANSDLITLTSVAQSHGTRLDSLENKDNLIELQIDALDIRVTNAESTLNLKANTADVNAANTIQNNRLTALEAGNTTGVSQGVYNAKMSQLDLTNDSQDLLIAGKVDNTTYNAKISLIDAKDAAQDVQIANLSTSFSQFVTTSTYNGNLTSQANTDNNQNSRLTTLESFVSSQTGIDANQDTLIAGKLNTSVYNSDKALTDAAISFLNSSLNANDVVTASNTSRIVVLEGRQYPQTAAQTPYTAVSGVGGTLNVQQAIQSLQTNIDNIVVSGSGFSAPITTLINNMSTPYLGGSLITAIPGTGANNLQAKMWSHVRDLNQNLNSDFVNGPSFRKTTLVAGNGIVTDLTTNKIFNILGNTNGNNDSSAFAVYKDGSIRSDDKLFVGGPALEQYSLGRNGLRLSTNATFGSTDGGATTSYNGAIIKLNTITQNRAEQLRDLVFPYIITNGSNTVSITCNNSNNTASGFSVLNDGTVRLRRSNNLDSIVINPDIMTFKGNFAADTVVMQVNAPNDFEARIQLNNNGKIRLWSAQRGNTNNPGVETTEFGGLICQDDIWCQTLNAGNIVSTVNIDANTINCDGLLIGTTPITSWKNGNGIDIRGGDFGGPHYISLADTNSTLNLDIGQSGTRKGPIAIQTNGSVINGNNCVVIGDSNTVNRVLLGDLDIRINNGVQVIGNSNTIVDATNEMICIGARNNLPTFTTYDNIYSRICIGLQNDCRGTHIIVGDDNDLEINNPNGRGTTQLFAFGRNWKFATSGNSGVPLADTVFLGNGSTQSGRNSIVIGGGANGLWASEDSNYLPVQIRTDFSNGQPRNLLVKIPSSIRYKENVQEFVVNPDDFMKLNPVSFKYKETNWETIGLIAEELNEIPVLNKFVTKSEAGIEGIRYEGLIAPMISMIKQQEQRIKNLENMVREILKLE